MEVGKFLNSRQKRWLGFVIAIVLIIFAIPLLYSRYVFGVEGYVYDEVTGKPIEGVGVIVAWPAEEGVIMRAHSSGWGGVEYASSDKDGYFSVPSWIFFGGLFTSRRLADLSPDIFLVRSGHVSGFQWFKDVTHSRFQMKALPLDPHDRYNSFFEKFVFVDNTYNPFGSGFLHDRSCNSNVVRRSVVFMEAYKELILSFDAGVDSPARDEYRRIEVNTLNTDLAKSLWVCDLYEKGHFQIFRKVN